MFRWYDPLRSWPLRITVLWKSHLYSSQRCGMLWCLSAEKCTRQPSNAAMTHTDTDKVLRPLEHSMSGADLGCTFEKHIPNKTESYSSPLATRLSSDMGLVSFFKKWNNRRASALLCVTSGQCSGVTSGSDPQTSAASCQLLLKESIEADIKDKKTTNAI